MRILYAVVLCGALAGCAAFDPGPPDATGQPTPSAFEEGVREAGRVYDESPWEAFGPWGAGVAGLLAAAAGVRKGVQVYKRRKNAPQER